MPPEATGSGLFGERYRVERELGRGGMATVYLCTDTKFDRQVAIKLLHPDLAAAVGAERFHREIRIATGLTHPNILSAYDSEEVNGSLFYVMPFVDGESLRDRLDRERQLPVDDAIRITCDVADALRHAHAHGIVHRDIKPENILLQADHAVVADFGIARAVTSAADAEALTQTGITVGTPAYMSPEQALGEKTIDGRSDQYSLACVLFEMLAGQPPFVAPTFQALVARHLSEAAPLISTVRPSIPDELEDVILRALEKVPADRFPGVGDFADTLSGVVATTGTWTRRTMARARPAARAPQAPAATGTRRIAFAAGMLAALTLITIAGWRWVQPPAIAGYGDLDPSRIAVLYFDDINQGGDARHLADGLTESLIAQLSGVAVLDVVSRDGVSPFRGTAIGADSVGRVLRAGSVVRGSVELTPRGTRVNVRLLDGNSGVDLARRSFEHDTLQVLAMQDSVAVEVAAFLRQRLGPEVRLRDQRGATRSAEAWLLVQRAERRHKDADSLFSSGLREPGLAALAEADSLLSRAEAVDRAWAAPSVIRAAVAHALASHLRGDPVRRQAVVESGLAHAARALAIEQRNADAMEQRGKLLYQLYLSQLMDPIQSARTLAAAESALTRAVSLNRNQAGAWFALSQLHYRKPDLQAVLHASQRAYESDAYMRNALVILNQLFLTSYNLGHTPEAMRWLNTMEQRFPGHMYFIEGRLLMYWTRFGPVHIDSVWTYVRQYDDRVTGSRPELLRRRVLMYAAGALANAQLADSARRVLLRARAPLDLDPRRELAGPEAAVRVQLGDHDLAVDLIREYITLNPDHRRGFADRSHWMWRDLQNNPRFQALIAGL